MTTGLRSVMRHTRWEEGEKRREGGEKKRMVKKEVKINNLRSLLGKGEELVVLAEASFSRQERCMYVDHLLLIRVILLSLLSLGTGECGIRVPSYNP